MRFGPSEPLSMLDFLHVALVCDGTRRSQEFRLLWDVGVAELATKLPCGTLTARSENCVSSIMSTLSRLRGFGS